MSTPTQRTLKCVTTGIEYRLYQDSQTHAHSLIYEGEDESEICKGSQVRGYYACPGFPVQIKINGSKTIDLAQGEFYHLNEGEKVTHRKIEGFDKRFKKV